MTEPSNKADGSMPEASNEAAGFLGDQPNEVALFALGHRPTAYRPLTEAEVRNLRAAVAGKLPASLSDPVRELLKDNSAATEFVLSEQLLTAANRGVSIRASLSNRILGAAKPVATALPSREWSIRSWRYVRVGAAAAALGIAISFYGLHRTDNPNFTIAALDDYEILADSGVVTRGVPQADSQAPKKPALSYIEVEIPRTLLADFFAEDQSGKRGEENRVISRLSDALNERDKVRFIFDTAIKPLLTSESDEMLAVRVYDLSNPANKQLASAFHSANGKGYFVSPENRMPEPPLTPLPSDDSMPGTSSLSAPK